MRRPWRIAEALSLLTRRELEQSFERSGVLIHGLMWIADLRHPLRHRHQREISRFTRLDFFPGERRRNARVGSWPHRIRRGDRAVLRVLVVVEEHAVAFFLPPFAGRNGRR